MRLDKNLWNVSCREYQSGSVSPSDMTHFTPSVRIFISLWLELLQNDRAPETRALRSLSIPDQLTELRNSLHLWASDKKGGRPNYRVRSAIARLRQQSEALQCPFAGQNELTRLNIDLRTWIEIVDEHDQKNRKKLEDSIRKNYSIATDEDVEKYLQRLIETGVVGTLSQIRGYPEFKSKLCDYISSQLVKSISPADFVKQTEPAIRELLALVLDRGNSRESLAELPIKQLRADNQALAQQSLETRVRKIFVAFRGIAQEYIVYIPISGTNIDIPGKIFPEGVSLVDSHAWHLILSDFDGAQNHDQLPSDGMAFKVNTTEYLNSGMALGEAVPMDVFAARDLAVRAIQACLDAIFLYREHRIQLDRPCAVTATSEGGTPFRIVLQQKHEFKTQRSISLKFLRPVPSTWSDALHWYRLGNVTNKDEPGIVNLWTSAEILAASCHGSHGPMIDRVKDSVGIISALFLWSEEYTYIAKAACAYNKKYSRNHQLSAPDDDCEDRILLEWWIDLCRKSSESDLLTVYFDEFPLLGIEAVKTKALASAQSSHIFDEHQNAVKNEIDWIYACRNDVVHDGRVRVAGASIARALASEYVGCTLRETLTMRERGQVETLADSFALAVEKKRTLREMLAKGDVLNALLTPSR